MFALPIISDSPEDAKHIAASSTDNYSYLEFWLDYLPGGQVEFAQQMAAEYGGHAIFLLRRQNLEQIKLPIEERLAIIDMLSETDSFLDLDIISQKEEVQHLRQLKETPGTILSFHDYEKTPSDRELQNTLQSMQDAGADVSKIATFCQTESDALRLLKILLALREQERRCIVLGMGVHGAITRVFGTLWGNEMVFAPENRSAASAPGQLTRGELEQCFSALHSIEKELSQ